MHVGVVCGFGAAAAAWTIAGSPSLLDAECLAFVTLATLAGTWRVEGAAGRFAPFARSAAVAAALLVFGLGAALLVAELVTASVWLGRRTARGSLFLLGILHALAVAAMRALIPGLTYLGLGGTAPIDLGRDSLVAILGALAASVITTRTLAALAQPVRLSAASGTAEGSRFWPLVVSESSAVVAAIVIATVYGWPEARPWLLVLPAAAALTRVSPYAERGPSRARPAASGATRRAIAEALALASASRGRGDLAHLDRVEALTLDLAADLGLPESTRDALSAAALLHDVDLLALPLGDAGAIDRRIEPHPALGEEILDALPIPEAAREIVRHRSERWDGSGRPAGLAGEAIPSGARILAAVDAFDDWTWTGGPGRGPDEALRRLRAEAGARFDPRIVEALERCVGAGSRSGDAGDGRRSWYPLAGSPSMRLRDAARELHTLYEIERSVGYRLDLRENLLLVLGKLGTLVPHDTAAVYELGADGRTLRGRFALGAAAAALEGLELETDRLSVRAASARRTLAGGATDGFDLADLRRDRRVTGLGSALAAPLVAGERVLGALTLYAGPERRFDAEERRVLVAVAGHVAAALGRSDPRDASYLATLTDPSTGLPNARYLEICAADATRLGLVAFRWLDFDTTCERGGVEDATRAMGVLGRRIAAACRTHEVAARFGTDLFVVLALETEPSTLVERWSALLRAAESEPLPSPLGASLRVRCASAQAAAPADGRTLDALLGTLGARLGPATHDPARVVPFRTARSAG